MKNKFLLSLFCVVLFASSLFSQSLPPKREFRGAWIATVGNLDWPSSNTLTTDQQKAELISLLDGLKAIGINAVIFQVRSEADAMYNSPYEPWSYWLTGQQGKAPSPYYDPLAFAVQEAHKRGMEIHAWFNPYRVVRDIKNSYPQASNHVSITHPDWVVTYGNIKVLNPGIPAVRAYIAKIIADVVRRYDIDGVHFDDYFYPYRVGNEEFPDDATFKQFPRGFAPNQKDDWRRNNVNMIISELHETIKNLKPWVQFGVSPFGVWRNSNVDPRGSNTRAGVQNYDDLYADVLKWLKEGTIDYVVPQLYWEIGKKVADYDVLVKWWSENSYGKNLYIGLYASQLGQREANAAWRNGNEVIRQLNLNTHYPQVDGAVFFSARGFLQNKQGLLDSLKHGLYKYPSIQPFNRNIQGEASAQPQNIRILRDGKDAYLLWDEVNEEGGCATAYYIVYAFKGKKVGDMNNPANILVRTTENCVNLRELGQKIRGNYTFVVTALNRYKYESIPTYGVTRRM